MKWYEILFGVLLAVFSVGDVVVLFLNRQERLRTQNNQLKREVLQQKYATFDVTEEQRAKAFERLGWEISCPPEIAAQRGYAGRGNPSLSRRRLVLVKEIDRKIERVVRT